MSRDLPDTTTELGEGTKEPPNYNVILHNDDYTTKAFVVDILMAIFNKSFESATRLMWFVHKNSIGVCGTYPLEVAETKVKQVTNMARENGYPLKLTLEEE